MNKIRDTLIAARALIEDEKCWTKGVIARDEDGNAWTVGCTPVCWCATGAILCCETEMPPDREGALNYLRAALPPWPARSVPLFNDDFRTTHADVLAAFDRAIELAEKEAEVKAPGMWGWK